MYSSSFTAHHFLALTLAEFRIVQTTAENDHYTWLSISEDIPDRFVNTEAATEDADEFKSNSAMHAFTHFVYEQSNHTYLYDHFHCEFSSILQGTDQLSDTSQMSGWSPTTVGICPSSSTSRPHRESPLDVGDPPINSLVSIQDGWQHLPQRRWHFWD
jgi:hypothetical protein